MLNHLKHYLQQQAQKKLAAFTKKPFWLAQNIVMFNAAK